LSVREILNYYQRRWSQAVDFWYLKQELGLGDFRVPTYAALVRWSTVVYRSGTFVRWQW
jgi:hypothetical protein